MARMWINSYLYARAERTNQCSQFTCSVSIRTVCTECYIQWAVLMRFLFAISARNQESQKSTPNYTRYLLTGNTPSVLYSDNKFNPIQSGDKRNRRHSHSWIISNGSIFGYLLTQGILTIKEELLEYAGRGPRFVPNQMELNGLLLSQRVMLTFISIW